MYGFVNFVLEELVLRNFGEEIWTQIKKEASVEITGHFMIRKIYEDNHTYNLVTAATKVLDLPASAILELFGQFFFEFCVESGYNKILTVLGSSTKEFLQNLDALHDHLSTIYPGMKAPSFRCSEAQDGTFVLHYYSDRPGLEFIVIGLVKTVSFRLHNSEVDCKVIKNKGEDGCDHVQFHIIEKSKSDKKKNIDIIGLKAKLSTHLTARHMISQKTFCNAFPFHIIFDKNMHIKQSGASISRVIPQIKVKNIKLTDIFTITRPHIQLDFQSICSQIMSVFVLSTKQGILDLDKTNNTQIEKTNCTRFKGQMVYLKDKELVLFQCSPSVMSIDDLFTRGMRISDMPMHDSNRDLILMNEHWEEEWNLTQNLEILTDKLQNAYKELEDVKKKTDNLLYSVLPPSIAQQLRQDKPVLPAKFEQATLMFCGIKDFNMYCAKYANDSQKIVDLLNTVFIKFDEKTTKYPEVYKVETVGDKYMAVCGLPEKVKGSVVFMARAALDIIESSDRGELRDPDGERVVITIGINCGDIVTGVIGKRMPRYCLFGDTVNLTSRCETTGIKGKINISEYAYDHLSKPENYDPQFKLDFRGEIAMKGKPRPIKMWLLSRNLEQPKPVNSFLTPANLEKLSQCPFKAPIL